MARIITSFSSDEETEARIDAERQRFEELQPGANTSRSATNRVLIARGAVAIEREAL